MSTPIHSLYLNIEEGDIYQDLKDKFQDILGCSKR